MMKFKHGALAKYLRERAGMKQVQLAERIARVLKGRSPMSHGSASVRTQISRFESSTDDITIGLNYREAYAEVLKIPIEWFDFTWKSEAAFRRVYDEYKNPNKSSRPPSLAQIASSFMGRSMIDDLPDVDEDHRSASRLPVLTRFVEELRRPGAALLVVEGLSGYGKSSFVRLGLETLMLREAPRLVIAVRCANRTTVDIVRTVRDMVRMAEPRLSADATDEFIRQVQTIIVLDDADKIAGAPDEGSTPIAGARFYNMFSEALQSRANLKIVLTIRSSQHAGANLIEELSPLASSNPSAPFHLDQLSTEDVAKVIRRKAKASKDTAARCAQTLGGDPLRLATFVTVAQAETGGRINSPALTLIANKIANSPEDETRAAEMQPLLEAVRSRGYIAFLTATALAFAPGALTIDACRRIVAALERDEVLQGEFPERTDTIEAVLEGVLNEFTTSNHLQVELHSRVRSTFRELIAKDVGVEGVRTIRRRMAQVALQKSRMYVGQPASPSNFSDYFEILFHLIALYRLADRSSSNDIKIEAKANTPLPSADDLERIDRLLESNDRLLDRASIANTAFWTLLLSRADGEGGTRVTMRQLGDYEQKLKMLAMLMVDERVDRGEMNPLKELAQPYVVQLLLDIAVCASQSGLLDIAGDAIEARLKLRPERTTRLLDRITIELARDVPDDRQLARLVKDLDSDTEVLNVWVTTLLREARFAEAGSLIEANSDKARTVIAAVAQRREDGTRQLTVKNRRTLNPLLVASRRLISRRAHFLVLKGQFEEALDWFDLAVRIDTMRTKVSPGALNEAIDLIQARPTSLGGEIGRAYCCMLMHGGVAQQLQNVERHIAANLNKAEDNKRFYEVFDWKVLQASLERLKKDSNAPKTIGSAQKSRTQANVNVSFASSLISSLEEERQRLRGKKAVRSLSKLESVYKIADTSHHHLLACDAALLIAEYDPNPVTRDNWIASARSIIQRGYGFRTLDLTRIGKNLSTQDLL